MSVIGGETGADGHYGTEVKQPNGSWLCFDDHVVDIMPGNQHHQEKQGYIFLYQKVPAVTDRADDPIVLQGNQIARPPRSRRMPNGTINGENQASKVAVSAPGTPAQPAERQTEKGTNGRRRKKSIGKDPRNRQKKMSLAEFQNL